MFAFRLLVQRAGYCSQYRTMVLLDSRRSALLIPHFIEELEALEVIKSNSYAWMVIKQII